MEAIYYTAAELSVRGSSDIPKDCVSSNHLIYSSPATLAFNSPGAEGFGVKRAGLSVPDSVMLIVSPGCCGRNTSSISRMPGYEDRFYYLTMDEADLVTGRHLKKISRAVQEICDYLEKNRKKPRVVMLCITCVDALLGTDMERICRKAEESVRGVKVRPCYMYALTREGRRPPMVHVRQSIYELLEPRRKVPSSVNFLGFFAPVEGFEAEEEAALERNCSRKPDKEPDKKPAGHFDRKAGKNPERKDPDRSPEPKAALPYAQGAGENKRISADGAVSFESLSGSELYQLLHQAGVRRIRQIGACRDYTDFLDMAEANFNIVLNPEVRPAAYDLQERLGIPFIELGRFYQIDRIRAQYAALGKVLQTKLEDEVWEKEAVESVRRFKEKFPGAVFSVGEALNGNPFEIACALIREGFSVREIFGTLSPDSYIWIDILAKYSPDTRIYSNLHPSMLHYREEKVDISIGRDAGWYHPGVPNVQWNTDVQPFGYRAVSGLFRALMTSMETNSHGSHSSSVILDRNDSDDTPEANAPGIDPEPCSAGPGTQLTDSNNVLGKSGGNLIPDKIVEKQDEDKKVLDRDIQNPFQIQAGEMPTRGLRLFTTPFAPDQSGAVSVLFDMGGICVICDAGGCTGNICGFDEPRWFGSRSAVFSAGLRDMDAILGRDDLLVEKLCDASLQIPASFAAVVGTPVPSVIGTDYRALCRMARKKTGLPVLSVDSNGMDYYDRGIQKAYLALLETFCKPDKGSPAETFAPDRDGCGIFNSKDFNEEIINSKVANNRPANHKTANIKTTDHKTTDNKTIDNITTDNITTDNNTIENITTVHKTRVHKTADYKSANIGSIELTGSNNGNPAAGSKRKTAGVWGFSPLDFNGIFTDRELLDWIRQMGYEEMICPGAGTGTSDLARIVEADINYVLSPSGLAAARWLQERYGTPWEFCMPCAEKILLNFVPELSETPDLFNRKKVLIVHQQILADSLRSLLTEMGAVADTAGFFLMNHELMRQDDRVLREEIDLRSAVAEKGYEYVIADKTLSPLLKGLDVVLIHLPHFAVSGYLTQE